MVARVFYQDFFPELVFFKRNDSKKCPSVVKGVFFGCIFLTQQFWSQHCLLKINRICLFITLSVLV